jgi:hypothetical protein
MFLSSESSCAIRQVMVVHKEIFLFLRYLFIRMVAVFTDSDEARKLALWWCGSVLRVKLRLVALCCPLRFVCTIFVQENHLPFMKVPELAFSTNLLLCTIVQECTTEGSFGLLRVSNKTAFSGAHCSKFNGGVAPPEHCNNPPGVTTTEGAAAAQPYHFRSTFAAGGILVKVLTFTLLLLFWGGLPAAYVSTAPPAPQNCTKRPGRRTNGERGSPKQNLRNYFEKVSWVGTQH